MDLPTEMLNVQLFKVLQKSRKLGLELEHERKQRASEQRMINQVLQSISSSEMELGYAGRSSQTLGSVVSKLIQISCSPHMSSHIYIQSLAKKIVTIYSNQLKHIEDHQSYNRVSDMNLEPEDEISPAKDVSRHISYSLFGNSRVTSAALDSVEEAAEEEEEAEQQLQEYSSESEEEASIFSESSDEQENEAVIIDDVSEIRNILCYIVDQVVDPDDQSSYSNNEQVTSVQDEAEEAQDVTAEIGMEVADAGVQTDADQEKSKLVAEVHDLKEAIGQQSLQLLLSNEHIMQLQSSTRRKQAEDDLNAYRDLVLQQSALLKKVTLELEETKKKLNTQLFCVSVPMDQGHLSDAHSESELFDEILINQSDDVESCSSHRGSNMLTVTSLDCHSDVRSSTPNIESKVRDVTLKLRQLFQLR